VGLFTFGLRSRISNDLAFKNWKKVEKTNLFSGKFSEKACSDKN
jgi:hypothetical protein